MKNMLANIDLNIIFNMKKFTKQIRGVVSVSTYILKFPHKFVQSINLGPHTTAKWI